MNPTTRSILLAALVAAASSAPLAAGVAGQRVCPVERARLVPPFPANNGNYGRVTAADNGTLVLGAPLSYSLNPGRGYAEVWVRSGTDWTLQQRLSSSAPSTTNSFGGSVGIDGDTIAVGDAADDGAAPNGGAVEVFVRSGTTWTSQGRLFAPDAASSDGLGGTSVTVSGDTLAVGAVNHDVGGFGNAGAVYLFERTGTTWSFHTELTATVQSTFLHYGTSVSLSGDLLAVGAQRDSQTSSSAGAVYWYERVGSSWVFRARLAPGDLGSGDFFGQAVALDGTWLAAGTPNNGASGAAYVFEHTGSAFVQRAKLTTPNPQNASTFGYHVDLEGDRLLVGDYLDTVTFAGGGSTTGFEGSAYVFERSGTVWSELAQLIASDGELGDEFGFAGALSGGDVLVGASRKDAGNQDSGAAYVFELMPSEVTYCSGKTSSLSCIPWIVSCGTPSATDPEPFRIVANDMIAGEAGLLLYSTGSASLDFHGGKLCIKAPFVTRFPPKKAKSLGAPPCSGVLRRNFNKRIQSGVDPLLTVGQTVYAQWRARDLSDPAGFGDSLSDAVTFTIQP